MVQVSNLHVAAARQVWRQHRFRSTTHSPANVVLTGLYLVFLGAALWVATIMYREHRGSLYLLPDSRRALLYIAVAVFAVTLTATHRLWSSPAGSVAWLVLMGASVYVGFAVIWAARRY